MQLSDCFLVTELNKVVTCYLKKELNAVFRLLSCYRVE